MQLSQGIAKFLEARTVDGYSPNTIRAYTLQGRLLLDAVGDPDLEAVTTDALRQYLGALTHLKPASLGHRIRFLHSLWHWLQDEEYTERNPTHRIREPKAGDRIPKALSVDQLEDLRDACDTLREHALLELFFATGCRLSEVAGMNRDRLQWDRRAIRVIGKGDKEREVYWGAKADRYLRKYLASRTDDDPAVFVTERQPFRRMHSKSIYHAIKRVAHRAGMDDTVWPHVLRHTLATTLLNNGADLTVIQSYLGHTKPSTTLLYATLSGTRRKIEYDRYFTQ